MTPAEAARAVRLHAEGLRERRGADAGTIAALLALAEGAPSPSRRGTARGCGDRAEGLRERGGRELRDAIRLLIAENLAALRREARKGDGA